MSSFLRNWEMMASKWYLGLAARCFHITGGSTSPPRWRQVLGLPYTRNFGSSVCAKALGTTNREESALEESGSEAIENADGAEQKGKSPSAARISKAINGYIYRKQKIWTESDLETLIALHKEGSSHAAIAQTLGRSYASVRDRLLRWRRNPDSFSPTMALRKNTTSADSDLLLQLKASGASWAQIQQALPGYPLETLRKVWTRHQDMSQLSDQERRRQGWTLKEDSALKEGRTVMKLTYKDIQKQLPGRSIEALKTRYAKIDGSYKPKRARLYSLEEMYRLAKLKEDRRTLAEIASEPGRSRTSVNNFYNDCLRGGYTIAPDGSLQWAEEWKKRHAFRLHRLKLDEVEQETKDSES